MDFYGIVVALISLLSALFSAQAAKSHEEGSDIGVILGQTSMVTAKVTIGETNCRHGTFYLTSPDPVFPPGSEPAGKSHVSNWDLLITDYGASAQSVQLGPYTKGTSISFGFMTDCGQKFSMDNQNSKFHLVKHATNFWHFAVEDSSERGDDYDDISLEITATAVQQPISAEIKAIQAFNPNPSYIYPWPTGKNYPLTAGPGQYEHIGRAFDFGLKEGDVVTAAEKGMVLWVEDSFGVGGCSISVLGKANIVVVQTEEGVNLNYLHLLKGSVKDAGVEVGEIVEKGQVLGKAGRSGTVCPLAGGNGAHLHIEFVHNCYDLGQAKALRKRYPVGKSTLVWNCTNFPKDSAYTFR